MQHSKQTIAFSKVANDNMWPEHAHLDREVIDTVSIMSFNRRGRAPLKE
jgi:hypothetical protein